MFVHNRLEDAVESVISSSFAANNVTNWEIHKGSDILLEKYPCVKIYSTGFDPIVKGVNTGIGRTSLMIMTCAVKLKTGKDEFEQASDLAFNPFLQDNIADTLPTFTTNLIIEAVNEESLEVERDLSNGWVATQKFEVVCGRSA